MTKAYICNDPALFNDTNYDGYQFVGDMSRVGGYFIKEIVFGEGGEILPTKLDGGSTIYFCDRYIYDNNSKDIALEIMSFGGIASDKEYDGLFCLHTYLSSSLYNNTFGSRLCFIPQTA